MAIVERGNVVLEVADDDVQRYLDKGYSVTDGNGNILQQTKMLSPGELHQIIANKDTEIAELKEQLAKLAEKIAKADESAPAEKPKRSRKTKSDTE